MASSKAMTEDLIAELNGCGRYQIVSTGIVLFSELVMVCSMNAMVFNGRAPDYRCIEQAVNTTHAPRAAIGNRSYDPLKTCLTIDDGDCSAFSFSDDFHTIVDEWDLVCDRKWIVAMITTLVMASVLLGCLVFGQVSDTLGRKPTYFISIICLVILNVGARFSVCWEMYAVINCLIGLAIGAFLVTRYVILVEFMSPVWQPRIMAIPAWPLSSCIHALFVWLLKDWRHVHLATAAAGLPFLFAFCFLQESSRWQLTEQKFKDAERSINKIARTNGKPKPNLSKLFDKIVEERGIRKGEKTFSHSPLDLFKTSTRLKTTLGILFIWFSVSYSYYGLTFGVGTLAGDFYLNLTVNNLVSVPSTVVVILFLQRLGRRYSCVVSFILLGTCGVISGAFRYIDSSGSTMVVRVFCFAAKMLISIGWGCLAVYTNELYPTVVRSIAIGMCNVAAQTGAMLAPQTVFLGDEIPGLLYFPNAALNIISGLLCLMFVETRDSGLEDTLEINTIIKTKGSQDNKQEQNIVHDD